MATATTTVPPKKRPANWKPAYLRHDQIAYLPANTPRPAGSEFLGPKPLALPSIDPSFVADAAAKSGANFTNAQFGALDPAFKQLSDQQYGSIQRIAGGLNNQYTKDARGQINQSFAGAGRMGATGNQLIRTGTQAGRQIRGLAPEAVDISDRFMDQIGGLSRTLGREARRGFARSGPTSIERELYRQGQEELALGRSLSPEQVREATQAARQGLAARGLATGTAALGAELLNRDRYATQRQEQRRSFAADANNLRERNVMDRRESAGGLAEAGGRVMDAAGRMGLSGRQIGGNLYGTGADTAMRGMSLAGSLMGDAGRLRQTGAGMLGELDPMQRALQAGLSLGQTSQGMGLETIGQGFGNMLDLSANTASFNVNRGDSFLNSWMNNATAIRTGQEAAAAQTNAANIMGNAQRAASRPTTLDYIKAFNPFD